MSLTNSVWHLLHPQEPDAAAVERRDEAEAASRKREAAAERMRDDALVRLRRTRMEFDTRKRPASLKELHDQVSADDALMQEAFRVG